MNPAASLRLWKAPTVLVLVLVVCLVPFSLATEYEYLGWKPDSFGGGRAYDKPPQCVAIPDDLRLCHGVGYNQMLLPNLLEHESMAEVRQQAGSWVPLVHKACHPGTRIFLCSLFAPVCMDRPIYPCRWLCETVRQGCEPIMEAFGFPWPEMLACNKFPQDEVCISTPNTTDTSTESGYSPVCPPCDIETNADAILAHMCASEFAIKTKIKEVKRENADRKVILYRRKKSLKLGSLKKKDLRNLTLYLKNGADCPCSQLDNLGSSYLIMGRKTDKQYLITGIHKWDKSNKEFKKTLKKLLNHKCPTYEKIFK